MIKTMKFENLKKCIEYDKKEILKNDMIFS